MKILVPIKRVLDYHVKPRIKSDGSGVDLSGLKMSINPFDEIAIEEAVRLKEAGVASEVTLVTIGPKTCQENLRQGMALGADRSVHVVGEDEIEPLGIAKVLVKIVEQEKPDLVIMGKQAIDNDCNQTGQMLAALLGWPQATFVSKLAIDKGSLKVMREVDGGLENLELRLPAVVTTDLRLNEPRYASLPNIMKAKQKPIKEVEIKSLGCNIEPRIKLVNVSEPPKRSAGIMVDSIDSLLDKLQNEAKVI